MAVADKRIRRSRALSTIISTLVLTTLLTYAILPLLWMLSTSFKTNREAQQVPATIIPREFSLKGYKDGWTSRRFDRYFVNTSIVTFGTTVIAITLGSFAGYGFSRFRMRGKKILLTSLLVLQMFPTATIIIPYFMVMRQLHLINTYWALIFAYTSLTLPLCVWMLKAFFDSIPRELDEAAMIDGCTSITTRL